MNFDFQLFQAKFNYLAENIIKQYQANRNKENLTLCSLLWELYYYTNNLQANNIILNDKYISETNKLKQELQTLQKKYEELHNTIRFTNLRDSRFSEKNDR